MNAFVQWLLKVFDTVFTPAIIPATFGGIIGGSYKGYHDKLSWKETLPRIIWGIIFARIFSPMVESYINEELQFIVFCAIGYGAIELVNCVLAVCENAMKDIIEAKVKSVTKKAKITLGVPDDEASASPSEDKVK